MTRYFNFINIVEIDKFTLLINQNLVAFFKSTVIILIRIIIKFFIKSFIDINIRFSVEHIDILDINTRYFSS